MHGGLTSSEVSSAMLSGASSDWSNTVGCLDLIWLLRFVTEVLYETSLLHLVHTAKPTFAVLSEKWFHTALVFSLFLRGISLSSLLSTVLLFPLLHDEEIGRASCRERV